MPCPVNPRMFIRTCNLRAPRWGRYERHDHIADRPSSTDLRTLKKIIDHPKSGWTDDYEKSGKHFSRRVWKFIRGGPRGERRFKTLQVRIDQERRYRYDPAIPWRENPAYWDTGEERPFDATVATVPWE